jgi:hypothetical protein
MTSFQCKMLCPKNQKAGSDPDPPAAGLLGACARDTLPDAGKKEVLLELQKSVLQ